MYDIDDHSIGQPPCHSSARSDKICCVACVACIAILFLHFEVHDTVSGTIGLI